MEIKEFLEQQKNCSKNCGSVDIEHCCECAFRLARQPEWNEGKLPAEEPVICQVETEDGRLAYKTVTASDNAPKEPVKGWWGIPKLG